MGWRFRATGAALAVPPLMAVVPLDRLVSRLALARVPAGATPDGAAMARWVDGVLRRLPSPWRRTCLRRSAVLFYLLRRGGQPVQLCIGMRREGVGFVAHAWLELDGDVVLEATPSPIEEYRVLARFPEG